MGSYTIIGASATFSGQLVRFHPSELKELKKSEWGMWHAIDCNDEKYTFSDVMVLRFNSDSVEEVALDEPDLLTKIL